LNESSPFGLKSETQQKIIYSAGCAYELTKWIIVAIIFFTLIHFFAATISIVDGISMEPNFHTGEYLIVNRWQYNFGQPERGDAVVLKFPGDPDHKKYIKRIIGLPGEHITVASGEVYVNNKKLPESYLPAGLLTESEKPVDVIVQKDEYFIMGDNRPNSNDSRIWGTANQRFLIGKAWLEIWPNFKKIGNVTY